MTTKSVRGILAILLYVIAVVFFSQYIISVEILSLADCFVKLNWVILFIIVLQFAIIFTSKIKITFSYFFIWCCYLFMLGQNYLLSVGYEYNRLAWSRAYLRYGVSAYISAIKYSILAIMFVFLGIILVNSRYSHKLTNENVTEIKMTDTSIIDIKYINYLSLMTFIVSSVYNIYRIRLCLTEGYVAAHDFGNANGFLLPFVQLFPVCIYLLLAYYKDNKRKARSILIFFIAYDIVAMLGGVRARYAIEIVIIVVLYFKTVEQLKIRYVVLITIVGVALLELLLVIRLGRATGSYDFSDISIVNTLYETVAEFGITINSIAKAFLLIDHPLYGQSLLVSFVVAIPGWSFLLGSDFQMRYNPNYSLDLEGLGGCFALDFYYDFGYLGGLVECIIYGALIAYVDYKIMSNVKNNQHIKNIFWVFFIEELLFTIRSFTFRLPRYCFYFVLVLFVLNFIYKYIVGKPRNMVIPSK